MKPINGGQSALKQLGCDTKPQDVTKFNHETASPRQLYNYAKKTDHPLNSVPGSKAFKKEHEITGERDDPEYVKWQAGKGDPAPGAEGPSNKAPKHPNKWW